MILKIFNLYITLVTNKTFQYKEEEIEMSKVTNMLNLIMVEYESPCGVSDENPWWLSTNESVFPDMPQEDRFVEEWSGWTIREIEVRLANDGVKFGCGYYTASRIGQAVMLAEAVNMAAKVIDYGYYDLKVAAVNAAIVAGARWWIGYDESGEAVTYIYHRDVGVASFHFAPVYQFTRNYAGEAGKLKTYQWSCWSRQFSAFDMLVDYQLRNFYAWATRPRVLGYPKPVWDDEDIPYVYPRQWHDAA